MLHDFNREFDAPSPEPEWLAERVGGLVAAGDAVALVSDRPPCGLALLRVRANLWSPENEAYLAELYVRPARRGRGLGRELLTAALDAARARGCSYLCLSVDEPDVPARRLYASMGFTPDVDRNDAPPALYLERSL